MHDSVLSSLPSDKIKALLNGREPRDQIKNRRQIIIKTLWEHRWRETVPRCLMCGWVTATSRAELTQSISRRDTSASLQRHSNNQREHLSMRLAGLLFPSLPTYTFPSVVPPCQNSDGRMCIISSVTMWCHPKLSCAHSLESIFTLIWVALLGSHLTAIHLIADFISMGNLLAGLAGHLEKYRKISGLARKHLQYLEISPWRCFVRKRGEIAFSCQQQNNNSF